MGLEAPARRQEQPRALTPLRRRRQRTAARARLEAGLASELDMHQAEGALAAIHERSPLVLPESAHAAWLDRDLSDTRRVNAIAAARVPPEEFTHWRVRLLVNDTRLDGPELIEPVPATEA